MTPKRARSIRLVVGWSFIFLGVLGLFLPILQGVLFIVVGLAILAPEWPWAHRRMEQLRARFPHMAGAFDRAHQRAEAWVHARIHRQGEKR